MKMQRFLGSMIMLFIVIAVMLVAPQALQLSVQAAGVTFEVEVVTTETQTNVVTSTNSVGIFQNQLRDARNSNSDVSGFLYVPGTNIQYPLVLNRSRVCSTHGVLDNCFYENHSIQGDYTGAYNNQSSIFVDSRNTSLLSDTMDHNTIIYGHNWTNIQAGSPLRVADFNKDFMFAQLMSFADLGFAQRTPYFIIENGDEQLVFLVFATAYVHTWNINNPNGFYYIETNPSATDFDRLISELRSRSEHTYNVPVSSTDKIVTLSTCTYRFGRDGNHRFVVSGRLARPGEDYYQYGSPISNAWVVRP